MVERSRRRNERALQRLAGAVKEAQAQDSRLRIATIVESKDVNGELRKVETQQNLAFDDPYSRTRSEGLEVVYACVRRSERFNRESLFGGFTAMRALTYTPSIPMILGLLRDYDYEDFECIFGHSGILSRDAADLLGFQTVVDEKLNKGFVGIRGLSEERRKIIYDRVAEETARFYVIKDAIAHAKIYLLKREGLKRVVVGSANLSEPAFSGRQAETLIAFDNDEAAWEHYSRQYDAVRKIASSKLPLREKPIPAELIPIEETPALKQAESSNDGVSIFVPSELESESPTLVSLKSCRRWSASGRSAGGHWQTSTLTKRAISNSLRPLSNR